MKKKIHRPNLARWEIRAIGGDYASHLGCGGSIAAAIPLETSPDHNSRALKQPSKECPYCLVCGQKVGRQARVVLEREMVEELEFLRPMGPRKLFRQPSEKEEAPKGHNPLPKAKFGRVTELSGRIRAARHQTLRPEGGGLGGMRIGAGADLRGRDLTEADFRGQNLRGARLSGADLSGADLRSADLSEADLRNAILSNARLDEALLSRANLTGAHLRNANLRRARLAETDLRGSHLARADFARANLIFANLSGADLAQANLRGANLSGATFASANLRSADLGGALLGGADLNLANLSGASLLGADLRGARNLTAARLQTAIGWRSAYRDPELACGEEIPAPVPAANPCEMVPPPSPATSVQDAHIVEYKKASKKYRDYAGASKKCRSTSGKSRVSKGHPTYGVASAAVKGHVLPPPEHYSRPDQANSPIPAKRRKPGWWPGGIE